MRMESKAQIDLLAARLEELEPKLTKNTIELTEKRMVDILSEINGKFKFFDNQFEMMSEEVKEILRENRIIRPELTNHKLEIEILKEKILEITEIKSKLNKLEDTIVSNKNEEDQIKNELLQGFEEKYGKLFAQLVNLEKNEQET